MNKTLQLFFVFSDPNYNPETMNKKVFPILLVFLCMGFGDAVGPFVSLAKVEFDLNSFKANLIPFVGFIGFLLFSIPAGIIQDRRGKKYVIILGMLTAMTGLVIPIFGLYSYSLFLIPILLLGSGSAITQVGGNPIMKDVSAEGHFSRNLAFGQFIKAIGTLSTAFLPLIAAKYFGLSWTITFPIYSSVILISVIILLFTKIKEKKYDDQKPATFGSCFKLLKNSYVSMMVIAIFLYVGAEVTISGNLPDFLKTEFGVDIEKVGLAGTGLFFLAIVIGRFSGSVILNWISARSFLMITTLVAIAGIASLFLKIESLAYISAFIIGLGFANIFPLIFSIAIDKMPEKTNELSGLMIMAIFGGALIPPVFGLIRDNLAGKELLAFGVPLVCVMYVLIISLLSLKKTH